MQAMSSTTKIAVATSTSSSTDVLGRPSTMPVRQHVDAVPRADVLAGPAQDAVVGVEHEVLRGLHPLGQPGRVDGLHDVVLVDVDLGLGERHRAPTGTRRWGATSPTGPRSFLRQFCMTAAPTRTMMIGTVVRPIAIGVAELLAARSRRS